MVFALIHPFFPLSPLLLALSLSAPSPTHLLPPRPSSPCSRRPPGTPLVTLTALLLTGLLSCFSLLFPQPPFPHPLPRCSRHHLWHQGGLYRTATHRSSVSPSPAPPPSLLFSPLLPFPSLSPHAVGTILGTLVAFAALPLSSLSPPFPLTPSFPSSRHPPLHRFSPRAVGTIFRTLVVFAALPLLGTIFGTLVAFAALPLRSLGGDGWKIAAALMGRHIGGAVNYVAVTAALQASPLVMTAALAAASLLCALHSHPIPIPLFPTSPFPRFSNFPLPHVLPPTSPLPFFPPTPPSCQLRRRDRQRRYRHHRAVNYVAVTEALQASPSVVTAALAADNLLCALHFTTLFAIAASIPAEGEGKTESSASGAGDAAAAAAAAADAAAAAAAAADTQASTSQVCVLKTDSSSSGSRQPAVCAPLHNPPRPRCKHPVLACSTVLMLALQSISPPLHPSVSPTPSIQPSFEPSFDVSAAATALALAASLCWLGSSLAKRLAFVGGTIPCVTALVLAFATVTPSLAAPLVVPGEKMAALMLQVFFASIGANGNLSAILS
ncbi:unnamed protein product [Closterium sp. NIES-65]|nr:unnamed protein product [Closterium sp. NIES-65]